MKPEVTILMATFNRAHFILESLKSIQDQTYKNWECIIVDDGSTDNTKAVITKFIKEDSRFIYTKRPDSYIKGLPGCRNYGLDTAKGDYIIFFDDDDVVHPSNLEITTSIIKQNREASFVVYQKQSFEGDFAIKSFENETSNNSALTNNNYLEDIVCEKTQMASCTVLWDKKCFKDVRFDKELAYAEEWECYTRILSKNIKGVVVDKVLYYNRKHANSNTGEFWRNSKKRVDSKKRAIFLIARNLSEQEVLSVNSFNYLVGLSINYRDMNLMNRLINISTIKSRKKWWYKIKFVLYPIWKKTKQITK